MEEKKATKVGCQACKKNNNIKNIQSGVFVFGGLFFILAIFGMISLVKFIMDLF